MTYVFDESNPLFQSHLFDRPTLRWTFRSRYRARIPMKLLTKILTVAVCLVAGIVGLVFCCLVGLYLCLYLMSVTNGVAHGDHVEWNGGIVKIVDYSGFPGSHMNSVEFHREGKRKEVLFRLGDNTPQLSVNQQGRLRLELVVLGGATDSSAENYPAELANADGNSEQIRWNGGIVEVVDQETWNGDREYSVVFHREGRPKEILFELGEHSPLLYADEYGQLKIDVDIWSPTPPHGSNGPIDEA